jgi:hypothetical protein
VFIQAATEGMTIFAGHEKPFATRMPLIEAISIKALTDLVKTIDSAAIRTSPASALASDLEDGDDRAGGY